MKMTCLIIASVLLSQGTQSSTVQYFKTGNTILKDAAQWERYSRGEMPGDLIALSYFQGYVAGALDAQGRTIQTPEGLTLDQACAIAAKFLRENPQRLHEPAADLIKEAFRRAYR